MSLLQGGRLFGLPDDARLLLATFSYRTILGMGWLRPRGTAPWAASRGFGDLNVGVGRPLDRYRCLSMQLKLIRLPQYKVESDRVFGTVFPTSYSAAPLPGPSSVRSLHSQGWRLSGRRVLNVGDSVVPWCVWVSSVKFSEFFQASCRKVVERLLYPVPSVRVVVPFYEVHDTAPSFGAAYDLVDVVLLALLDIVCFLKHLRWVGRYPVLAGSVGLQQRYMEDVVDFPFARQGVTDGEGRDNLLHLKGFVVLVVQLFRRSARFDVAPIEHEQVPYLIHRRLDSFRVRIAAHSLLCCFEFPARFLIDCVHPVFIQRARRVEGSCRSWVGGYRVESVVYVERRNAIARRDRVVVRKLGHWQESYPVVLLVSDERP